jgi:hypothetical protein
MLGRLSSYYDVVKFDTSSRMYASAMEASNFAFILTFSSMNL